MTVIGIVSALVIGAVIGALGRLVVPSWQDVPIWLTIVVGVVGAVAGTLLAQVLGIPLTPGVDWIEIASQIAVAAVGVAITASAHGSRSRLH
jgi:uncharacterized membrane protein YeaQ/YmgE (transglycosylase-associated protein family)